MNCFKVTVHGTLDWRVPPQGEAGSILAVQPAGFYCHRYVIAGSACAAELAAFEKVKANFDKQTGWLREGLAELQMSAEQIEIMPIYMLFRPVNRGHSFYVEH